MQRGVVWDSRCYVRRNLRYVASALYPQERELKVKQVVAKASETKYEKGKARTKAIRAVNHKTEQKEKRDFIKEFDERLATLTRAKVRAFTRPCVLPPCPSVPCCAKCARSRAGCCVGIEDQGAERGVMAPRQNHHVVVLVRKAAHMRETHYSG
jgi:hypothetical protein